MQAESISCGSVSVCVHRSSLNDLDIEHKSTTCLQSPNGTSPSHNPSATITSPHPDAARVECLDSPYTEDLRPGYIARVKARHGPIAALRSTQLLTMLMRCQVLQSTIESIKSRPWCKNNDDAVYWKYEEMKEIAYKARQLAEATHTFEVQARCEYWTGRACAETDDLLAAEQHLKRAKLLDVPDRKASVDHGRMHGLTSNERRDLDEMLRVVAERIDARNQGVQVRTLQEELEALQSAPPSLRGFVQKEFTGQEQMYIKYGKNMRPLSPMNESSARSLLLIDGETLSACSTP